MDSLSASSRFAMVKKLALENLIDLCVTCFHCPNLGFMDCNGGQFDTEPTIKLLCIVDAGNGVRVCHHVVIELNDTMKMAIGNKAIFQRTFNITKFQSITTMHNQ